jgi:mannose-1-phosphate guanylyltransferase
MKITAVIMAGGKGERFWPKSRTDCPKQFLSLTSDGETMIQKTVKRISPVVNAKDVFIVTNSDYTHIAREQLPDVPEENIISEPCARNTAPCIGLAAEIIGRKYDNDTVMLVLPSDHLIRYEDMYIDTLRSAVRIAEESSSLVTIGIAPAYPETGYGYINFERIDNSVHHGVYKVKKFVEKPDIDTAKEYLASGKYLWNSGMFVWKVSAIKKAVKEFLPDMYRGLEKIGELYATAEFNKVLEANYRNFESISVDFGIMEKSSDIYTVSGSFGWDDVGSWLAMERINRTNEYGNYISGDVITINTHGSIILGNKKLIASVGIDNLVVVDTDDALLICDKNRTQDVKKVIENLKICNRNELL